MTSEGLLRVFVYGSLREGGDNHHLLKEAVPIGNGTIEGSLYVSGNLSTVQEGIGKVYGEVYLLPNGNHLHLLDSLERHPVWYARRVVQVTLGNGTTVDAWCYCRAERDPEARRLDHGDYLKFRDEVKHAR
jgi:gamma-glutamylaminecyclotransferase